MGALDKFLNYMKLNGEEEEEYYDDEYYDDDEMEPEPAPRRSSSKVRHMEDYTEEHVETPSRRQSVTSNITSIRQPSSRKVTNGNNMEVCVVKPTSVDDGRDITQMLLSNRTVVLNLEGLDMDLAQRITDFVCGSCCAISGRLQKISNYILIITPSSVEISGDYQDLFNDAYDGE